MLRRRRRQHQCKEIVMAQHPQMRELTRDEVGAVSGGFDLSLVALNPQPLPPRWSWAALNPQPLPPMPAFRLFAR
jgi:hypothetical protein